MTLSAALGALVVSLLTLGVAAAFWRQRLDRDLMRTRQLAAIAEETGWSFTSADVFDYGAMPFALFGWKDGGRASNVIVGTADDGRPVCVFDFRTGGGDDAPARFTCVITDLGSAWPRLVVQPRDRGDRWPSLDVALLDRLPSVDAHDGFRSWSDDRGFARTVLQSPLGDWLETTWPGAQFEISGALLLVWFPQRSPRRLHDTLRASSALCSRIPGETWVEYPADRPGGPR